MVKLKFYPFSVWVKMCWSCFKITGVVFGFSHRPLCMNDYFLKQTAARLQELHPVRERQAFTIFTLRVYRYIQADSGGLGGASTQRLPLGPKMTESASAYLPSVAFPTVCCWLSVFVCHSTDCSLFFTPGSRLITS